jgi:hypothetical protein
MRRVAYTFYEIKNTRNAAEDVKLMHLTLVRN